MSGLFSMTIGRSNGDLTVVAAMEGIEPGSDLDLLSNAVLDALLEAVEVLKERGRPVTLKHMDGLGKSTQQPEPPYIELPKRRPGRKKAAVDKS
jgi:hypothetical protein